MSSFSFLFKYIVKVDRNKCCKQTEAGSLSSHLIFLKFNELTKFTQLNCLDISQSWTLTVCSSKKLTTFLENISANFYVDLRIKSSSHPSPTLCHWLRHFNRPLSTQLVGVPAKSG